MKSVRWAVALLIVVIVVVAFALAFGGGDEAPAAAPTATAAGAQASPDPATLTATGPVTAVPGMLTLARTSDPDVYADSVAGFLFSMDPPGLQPR